MASFDGTALWTNELRGHAGGVVYLVAAATMDRTVPIDGTECVFRTGSRCVVVRGLGAASFKAALESAQEVANKALDLPAIGGYQALSREAHAAGLRVDVWTIDKPDEMRKMLDIGVDGVMTDRPDLLTEVLATRP